MFFALMMGVLAFLIPTFHLRRTPSPRDCLYPALLLVFLSFFLLTPGRVLRGQPFFGTRRQQLSYRVMLVQGFLVAVLFAATVGVDVFYVVRHLLRQQAVPGASTGFTVVSVFNACLLVGPFLCPTVAPCHVVESRHPCRSTWPTCAAQLEGAMTSVSAERLCVPLYLSFVLVRCAESSPLMFVPPLSCKPSPNMPNRT